MFGGVNLLTLAGTLTAVALCTPQAPSAPSRHQSGRHRHRKSAGLTAMPKRNCWRSSPRRKMPTRITATRPSLIASSTQPFVGMAWTSNTSSRRLRASDLAGVVPQAKSPRESINGATCPNATEYAELSPACRNGSRADPDPWRCASISWNTPLIKHCQRCGNWLRTAKR